MESPQLEPTTTASALTEEQKHIINQLEAIKSGKLKSGSIDDLAVALFGENLEILATKLGVRDDPMDKQVIKATLLIKVYLMKMDPECARCVEYRSRGWNENKEEGDAFFRRQRQRADTASHRDETTFYNMMLDIGEEMQAALNIYHVPEFMNPSTNILDICMAPGGYSAVALKYLPEANAYGITLPRESGGHALIVEKTLLKGVKYVDVTMFKEYCPQGKTIPKEHPEYKNFSPFSPFSRLRFNIIFCEGAVLRTHNRSEHRPQDKETVRLQTSQLILAMQRIQNNGTIIMLLHKVDSWPSAMLLYTFSKFSDVEVFKPKRKHRTRSSFYMVAQHVNPKHADALKAVEEWKEDWYRATFGGPDGLGIMRPDPADESVQELLNKFGPTLASLGHITWKIQADALSQTEYAGSVGSERRRRSSTLPLSPPSTGSIEVQELREIEVRSDEVEGISDIMNLVTVTAPNQGREAANESKKENRVRSSARSMVLKFGKWMEKGKMDCAGVEGAAGASGAAGVTEMSEIGDGGNTNWRLGGEDGRYNYWLDLET